MDPADTQRATACQGAVIGRHEQLLQTAAEAIHNNNNLERCRSFLLQWQLVFSQHPRLFPSDRSNIDYIIGLLRRRALLWAQAISGAGSDLQALDEFFNRFEQIFDCPNFAGCVADRLITLHQGACSVTGYMIEFETQLAEVGWNKPALLCAFKRLCA